MPHWSLDDIPWDQFDRSKVDPDILKVVKAAGLTEYNARHYTRYLCNVFHDDARFQGYAETWAEEEVQHGLALGRWAEMAEPGYDFQAAFKMFTEGYVIPTDVDASIRGSRTGELLARCVVETGTSSFYSALADATDEPVLKAICRHVAADEFRHYKLFLDSMKTYQVAEKAGLFYKLKVAVGRLKEADDDELAYAYHCANQPGQPYDLKLCNAAYGIRAYGYYRFGHTQHAVAMVMKAIGLKPRTWLGRTITGWAWKTIQKRAALPRPA